MIRNIIHILKIVFTLFFRVVWLATKNNTGNVLHIQAGGVLYASTEINAQDKTAIILMRDFITHIRRVVIMGCRLKRHPSKRNAVVEAVVGQPCCSIAPTFNRKGKPTGCAHPDRIYTGLIVRA